MKSVASLRILTLNAGLLEVKLFNKTIIEPAPYIEERLHALPAAIRRTKTHLVALQEVYEQPHREFLIEKLKASHPHHFYLREKRPFRLEDSLMIFSQFPILKREILPFTATTIEEKLIAFKGVTCATIRIGRRTIALYNAYTTAGGARDPQSPDIEAIRDAQIRQIGKLISRKIDSEMVILAGDFNTGPQASPKNYALFKTMKLIDATSLAHPRLPLHAITWDPKNPLNRTGPHRTCPPQRIDHIFLREKNLQKIVAVKTRIVFSKPTVSIKGKKRVTVSDHYGLLAEMVLK